MFRAKTIFTTTTTNYALYSYKGFSSFALLSYKRLPSFAGWQVERSLAKTSSGYVFNSIFSYIFCSSGLSLPFDAYIRIVTISSAIEACMPAQIKNYEEELAKLLEEQALQR